MFSFPRFDGCASNGPTAHAAKRQVVVTELVFAYPGFGRMLLEASLFGDIATIEAATMVTVAIAVLTQLFGDIGYMLLNPQIRVG